MPDDEPATPLKEAIRLYWNAERLLAEAGREDLDPFVIENRKEDVRRYKALVQQFQAQTTTLVLTGDDGCDYGDERITIDAIKMLLQCGIIHECLECEEQQDLASCYDGDHREFHMSGDHTDFCLQRALHDDDPTGFPEPVPPDHTIYDCEECGIVCDGSR